MNEANESTTSTTPAPMPGTADTGPEVRSAPPVELPGVIASLGALPPGALVTEAGLAGILGKCTASIKSAVKRGELPWPCRIMGKNTWTAGAIIRHIENRLEKENQKFLKLRH